MTRQVFYRQYGEELCVVAAVDIVTIRPATMADAPIMADLLVREFQLYPAGQPWLLPLVRLGIQVDLQQRLNATKYACLVAVDATQKIVGTVEIGYRATLPWPFEHAPYPYLSNLAVRSTMRQQGIARCLLAKSEELVKCWQAQDIYLHVMADNFAARQLYLKSGYMIHDAGEAWKSAWGITPRLFLHKRLHPVTN